VKARRRTASDLRAASKLAVDAVREVTRVVEAMHLAIGGGPPLLGRPLRAPLRFLTAPIYGGIRATTGVVGAALDTLLAKLDPLLGDAAPGPEREAFVAALNGVLGDYLEATASPLAIAMDLRRGGEALPLEPARLRAELPAPRGKVVLLIHGSSMNDLAWRRHGHDHGAALESRGGSTALYLRYNSGLHVSTNGERLASLLEQLVTSWPVPLDEIVLVGHSMGGLVARSACRFADDGGHSWRTRVRALVTLGTPHHGAPLEQGGSWLQFLLGISSYSAPLARLAELRSAGVTDLRFGNVIDAHWTGVGRFEERTDRRAPVPLPKGVECYAIAGTLARRLGGRLPGDGLVPVPSALGKHRDASMRLAFPGTHQLTALGTDHLALLASEEVSQALARWLG
jgi:pimeloyl-ACP methyl ester carboxylesterase